MRATIITAAAMLALCFGVFAQGAADGGSARKDDGSREAYFGPGQTYRVTIVSENGLVSTLELPRGVYLSVFYYQEPGSGISGAGEIPRSFEGNLRIRIRRADEMQEGESRVASDIMAKAPFDLELRNATALVEVVSE